MKLPDHCPYASREDFDFIENEVDVSDCCRAARPYRIVKPNDPLCLSQLEQTDAYRFFWISSFHGQAIVHIVRSSEGIALRSQRTFGTAHPPVALSLDDWERLQGALKASNFWTLDFWRDERGFDGAEWLIEGRCGDDYHVVSRWCPRGAIYDLGRLFFDLAGPPLVDVRLY